MGQIDLGDDPIPEIRITFKEVDHVVLMHGHTVYNFWPEALKVMGWEKLTSKQVIEAFIELMENVEKLIETEGAEGDVDKYDMDDALMCRAVDLLLPPELKGQLRLMHYREIFVDAFRICMMEIYPAGESLSGKARSSAE